MTKKSEKVINQKRFYHNPLNGDKVFTEYSDGSKIVLTTEQKKKAEECVKACITHSLKTVEENPHTRIKPKHLREGKRTPDVEPIKKE